MNYSRQPNQPDFFKPENPLHFSATAGTSPFNEWYAFDSEEDAFNAVASFTSQSFMDEMMIHKGTLYYYDDLTWNDEGAILEVREGAVLNDFQNAIQLESRF